ncbi:MAG: SDR family NAD(P)-dependent oxidoreductase [Bacteroidales bacterium]|nr:SDR family NAD(P)-dependent oxidoreductase [Bacteroidales bacterium]
MQNKKIFVTGAGGFIGSHLCERLVMKGAEVTALIRYNSKGSHGFLEDTPSEIKDKIKVVFGDIRDESTFREQMKDQDIVYHLAAVPGIPYSFMYPRDIFDNNTLGSLNLLNASRDLTPGKIILVSTAETYGDSQYLPIDEKHPQIPKSPYAACKAAMENLAWGFVHAYEMPITIVRLFNNYGPRQSARAVTPTIISQMLNGDVVKIGSLHPKRDFTFVLDTVEALTKVALLKESGEVFNIGSNCNISVREIIEAVSEILHKKELQIITDETRIRPGTSEVEALRANYARLNERTGWKPEYSYKKGLEMTINWLAKNLHLYKKGIYTI